MSGFFSLVGLLGAIVLTFYAIKRYFDFRTAQGNETSNAPLRQAIIAILAAFVLMAGVSQLIVDMVARVVFGAAVDGGENSQRIGLYTYAIFCFSIVSALFFYYRNRHKLYQGNSDVDGGPGGQKNVVKNSQLNAGGDIHIGDKNA